ncbi:MAG TPA: cytochrome P460 family protein [Gammaproteobacteria bacterium]|nr:cytochrome P460 family protein [Gammaproteobacteria bacterium]
MKITVACSALVAAAVLVLPATVCADGNALNKGTPAFTAKGELKPPTDYYSWVFLTSDLGMSYNEEGGDSAQPPFSNVFVNPIAYQAFLKTGTWPEHTQLIKEFRASGTQGSINHHGFYQKGKPLSVLVHVKDTSRFKGGWAFFAFSGDSPQPAKQIPTDATCYSCHEAHGAVDTTFVQFYPSILPVAIRHSTLSKNYLADEAQAKKKKK